MKLTLRRDTAKRIVARLLLDAFSLELNHRTPVTGEKFTVRPVTIERRNRAAASLGASAAQGNYVRKLRRMRRSEPIQRMPELLDTTAIPPVEPTVSAITATEDGPRVRWRQRQPGWSLFSK